MTALQTSNITSATHTPPDRSTFPTLTAGLALVLTGLFAGFFGTYSFSVVRGLAATDDTTYVTAFQGINATIKNFEFAVVFFGALPAITLAMFANRSNRHANIFRLIAAVLVLATVAITFIGNVPLNNELAASDAAASTAARASFESTWNQLNLARTVTSALAFAALATGAVTQR